MVSYTSIANFLFVTAFSTINNNMPVFNLSLIYCQVRVFNFLKRSEKRLINYFSNLVRKC